MTRVRGRRRLDRRIARSVTRVDRRLLLAAANTRSPAADRALTGLSTAANNGVLWYGCAAVLYLTRRRAPRTAVAGGLGGMALTSALVNGPLKFLWQRERPPTSVLGARGALLPLPRTFSFPSGHSASAFAFAAGATSAMPALGPALLPLAGGVAYSRVHSGVHYPSDVVVGSAVGALVGTAAGRLASRVRGSSVEHPAARPLDVPVPRRAALVTSPNAGSAGGLDAARAALIDSGYSIEDEIVVGDIDGLADRLRTGGELPLVVAAGGDGTVGACVDAVHGTDALLAILPLGTSNDVARSLGVPPHPVEAAQALTDGVVVAIDVGEVAAAGAPARTFLNAATVGVNVAFAELATQTGMRNRFGALTYPVAAAMAVRRHVPFPCTLTYNGHSKPLRLVHLSVSNAPLFGGLLGMRVPGADIADGRLDVVAIERLSVAALVAALAQSLVGRHHAVRGVHIARVESLTVSGDSDDDIAVDGEVVGGLPARFAVRAGAVRVVVPRPDSAGPA